MYDYDASRWAKDQLAEVGVSPDGSEDRVQVYRSVMQLLDVFWQQYHTLQTDVETLDLFNALARDQAVGVKPDENWVPLSAGQFRKGATVRVKSDAFTGELGRVHNGRRGVIADIRRGSIVMNSRDNREPELRAQHYQPEQLEGLYE